LSEELLHQATIIPLPTTAAFDATLQKALSPLDVHVAFELPFKDGSQASFLVGRNTETGNWIAIGAARGGKEEQKAVAGAKEGQKPQGPYGKPTDGEIKGDCGRNIWGGGVRRRRAPGRGGGAGEAGEAPPVDKGKERPQEQPQPPQQQRQASRQPRQQPQQQPESTAAESEPSGARGRGRGRGGRRRRRGGGAERGRGAAAPADAGRAA
jgi:hypothetical protein